ncbi:MAG: phosphoenolpyruvate--protein phosphotransferase [Sphaerochaetaceae bacterium]
MRILKGIAASSGIGIGKAFLFIHEKLIVGHNEIPVSEIVKEKSRFLHALDTVAGDLQALSGISFADDQLKILETHLLMLQDPEVKSLVYKAITDEHKCAEWAVESVISNMIATLDTSPDPVLRERGADIYDIGWRVIRSMMGKLRPQLSTIHDEVVLVADTLLPSEALSLDPAKIKGIALGGGGRTSHVAILARALRIPTVVGLGILAGTVDTGDEVIVDGNHGEVSIRPGSATANRMRAQYNLWIAHEKDLQGLASLEAVTTDGHRIQLKANVETVEEVSAVLKTGADGIGLYRSEFLFMKQGGASEEEQFAAYRSVLEGMGAYGPVTIRTIDVGGDKIIPGLEGFGEENPILGWRAVRFCLSRKDIFRVQLKALLRASAYGKLKIMFPMVSGLEELENVLEVFEQVKKDCLEDSIPFDSKIEVGTMIEVPSAALCADLLAPKMDFFSIGTNDLIQYTIAVDRGNEKIAYLYQPFHPGVLRFIKMIVEKGHQAGIPVGMCGEMAGDPISSVLLLGLGLDEFSMSPQSLLEIKNIIRSVSLSEAKELAKTVMEMDSYIKIDTYIREWMHDRFGNYTTA